MTEKSTQPKFVPLSSRAVPSRSKKSDTPVFTPLVKENPLRDTYRDMAQRREYRSVIIEREQDCEDGKNP